MQDRYLEKEYKVSRGAYKAQCAFDYFIALLVSDAFLAKLLKHIGIGDALTGVISSLITITFLFQLAALVFAERVRSVKRTVIVLDTLSQISFTLLFLVPFFPLTYKGRAAAVVIFILFGYILLYLNNNIAYKWGNSFVDPEKRSVYSAEKEMISLISGIAFTLTVGFIVDGFEKGGRLRTAFIFMACCMAVVTALNFVSLSLIKDAPIFSGGAVKKSARLVLKNTFGNPKFRKVIIVCAVSEFARYLTFGFLGTFKTLDLGFSLGQVQIINTAAYLTQFAMSRPIGMYSDRRSYAKGYTLASVIGTVGYVFTAFASPASRWCVIIGTILYQVSLAGTFQNSYCMAYYFSDPDYVLEAMAVNNSVKGTSGFLASLIGGRVLSAVQANGDRVLGVSLYGQQLTAAFSALLTAAAAIYSAAVVEKLKGTKQ